MCTVLLAPGVNPIAVNKYINMNKGLLWITLHVHMQAIMGVGDIIECCFFDGGKIIAINIGRIYLFFCSNKSRKYTTMLEQPLHSLSSYHTVNSNKLS